MTSKKTSPKAVHQADAVEPRTFVIADGATQAIDLPVRYNSIVTALDDDGQLVTADDMTGLLLEQVNFQTGNMVPISGFGVTYDTTTVYKGYPIKSQTNRSTAGTEYFRPRGTSMKIEIYDQP